MLDTMGCGLAVQHTRNREQALFWVILYLACGSRLCWKRGQNKRLSLFLCYTTHFERDTEDGFPLQAV